jgi:hypothetical protein
MERFFMGKVAEFSVVLPEIDGQVDMAFKKRLLTLLNDGFEGQESINIMSAYLMWKYRDDWGEMGEDV